MDNSSKVVLGAIAGLAAGAALGLLFAPNKGADTRKKISKKGNDYMDDMKEKFDDLMENITAKIESVKAGGDELAEKGKSKLNHVRVDHVK